MVESQKQKVEVFKKPFFLATKLQKVESSKWNRKSFGRKKKHRAGTGVDVGVNVKIDMIHNYGFFINTKVDAKVEEKIQMKFK